MVNNLTELNIKVFVFGTLRIGERLAFYMDGSNFKGLYYTKGQLMKSELGSVYIDFKYDDAVTLGELHTVNYPCLQRINHLEAVSGEFPKGYDLSVIPVWKLDNSGKFTFDEKDKTLAFFYRRRNDPVKILSGDYTKHLDPISQIGKLLSSEKDKLVTEDEIINGVQKLLLDIGY